MLEQINPSRTQSGFTLTELLITVGIVAILAATAAPSFVSLLERRRLIGAANEMSTDIQYARSLSVTKKTDISLATQSTSSYAIVDSSGTSYKSVTLPTGVSVNTGTTVTFSSLNGFLSNTTNTVTFSLSASGNSASAQIQTTYLGRVIMVCGFGSSAQRSLC